MFRPFRPVRGKPPASSTGAGPTDADPADGPEPAGRTAGAQPLRDARAVAFAAVLSLLTSGLLVGETRPETTLLVVDQVAGGLACAALWLRARWPAGLAVVLVVAGAFSHFLTGPLVVALFSAATRCRARTLAGLVALSVAVVPISLAMRPDSRLPDDVVVVTKLLMLATVAGWGLFVRYRRELAATLYRQAQRDTRDAVAREMHDVLAHRLSLLSVHAGALEYRSDASREQVQQAAGVIRESAHRALEDLREVIGVLRADPAAGTDPEAGDGTTPQPTLRDLPRLVAESRQAGGDVALHDRVERDGSAGPDPSAGTDHGAGTGGSAVPDHGAGTDHGADSAAPVPASVGRTAYRVIQEGLTNARKHAPGQAVHVDLSGGPGQGLTVEVRNPVPGRHGHAALTRNSVPGVEGLSGAPIPGGGLGLVGLAERVELAGGRLDHGRTGGEFRLRAWLPWSA